MFLPVISRVRRAQQAAHRAQMEAASAQLKAQEQLWADYRAAHSLPPDLPALPFRLAELWAEHSGEDWSSMTEPEREARAHKASVQIARARD